MSNLIKSTAISLSSAIVASSAFLAPVSAETFRTRSFSIDIQVNCAEGNVTCNDVTYVGTNLQTGKAIRLKGKTIHTWGADGVPHRFIGYEFRNREYVYRVTDDRKLEVYRRDKLILTEQGLSTNP